MRWLDHSPTPYATAPPSPKAAREAFLWVTEGVGEPPLVAYRAVADLLAGLPMRATERDTALLELVATLSSDAPEAWIGLPPRVWENLLTRASIPAPAVAHRWIGDREAEGTWHDGVTSVGGTEWWADPRRIGACYGDRLWAWGTVQGRELPRCGWNGQTPNPVLKALVDRVSPRPLIDRGPAHLLACVAEGCWQLSRDRSLTHRDAAALWGGYFLPLLAPALPVSKPPADAMAVPPDYALQLGFHLLHPRARVAVLLMDQVATWADSGDLQALSGVLGDEVTSPDDAVARLLEPVARAALARRAAAGWDGGIGFRLLRRVLRAIDEAGDRARAVDDAFHGHGAPVGPLADRLREAFGTALTYADRPKKGAATHMLVDLVFLRWTDPDFLR